MSKCIKCGKPIRNNRSICSFCDGYMCGYEQGRADMKKEIEEHSVFYSNRPIEDIVLEARADAIDETISRLNSVLHDLYVKCRGNYQEFYNAIKEQLKEQK